MATDCPDNSTDCLLRAILEASDPGYNWDPLTFGFTAVFTFIAFVVSVFALFQSFVAAGPGRLKASERAIGRKQHITHANTQFSWKEFRFRTIVNVPVLDITRILDHAPAVISISSNTHPAKDAVRISARIVAGWSQLLEDLSLGDIDFDTIECLTDYLPDDVAAAPAWARVETIMILCILKGCSRLFVGDDGYINATGLSVQLSWNMHPSLGPIAVYRTWDANDTSKHMLQEVQRMIPICLGKLYLSGENLFGLLRQRRGQIPAYFDIQRLTAHSIDSLDRCQHDHDHCLNRKRGLWAGYFNRRGWEGELETQTAALAAALFADRPARFKAFPSRVSRMHSALKTVYDEHFPWLMLVGDFDDSVLRTLCGSAFVEFGHRDATADPNLADDPNTTSWLVLASKNALTKSDTNLCPSRPILYNPGAAHKYPFGKTSNQFVTDEKIVSANLRISRIAVSSLSKWLVDDTFFETADFTEIRKARQWLTYQLHELDWFLCSMGDDAICAASNLVALGSLKFDTIKFTKVSRRFVLPETLEAFNLNWTVDPSNDGAIIIRGYLDTETLQGLFKYTKNYIEMHRSELHTIKCAKAAQGFYYATKKHTSKQQSPTDSEGHVTTGSDALLESSITNSTDSSRTPTSAQGDSRQFSAATFETMPNIDPTITSDGGSPRSDTTAKPGNSTGDPNLRTFILEGRRLSVTDDEVSVHVDRRVAALEALTFFRAGVLAALLATGTDTSVILSSEKRYQLVQVQ